MAFVLSGVIAGYINKFANKYLESVGGSHIKFDFRKQKGIHGEHKIGFWPQIKTKT